MCIYVTHNLTHEPLQIFAVLPWQSHKGDEFRQMIFYKASPHKLLLLLDKLLLEISNCSRPLNDSKVEGMIPRKTFPLMEKIRNLMQLPRLIGILPNNLFSEIFKNSRFFFIYFIFNFLLPWEGYQ